MNTYMCPVCGYDKLDYPPEDYNICPCCATEFGISDVNWTIVELRHDWVARGMKWWYEDELPSKEWNPYEQLKKAGFLGSI